MSKTSASRLAKRRHARRCVRHAGLSIPYNSAQREVAMAVVMIMHWREVTEAQYEQTRQQVRWETDVPEGAKFHVAWFEQDGLHVIDLWDSREQFERFRAQRLGPAVQQIGIQGQPVVKFADAHAVFAPNV
jgi:hypothetical protein